MTQIQIPRKVNLTGLAIFGAWSCGINVDTGSTFSAGAIIDELFSE